MTRYLCARGTDSSVAVIDSLGGLATRRVIEAVMVGAWSKYTTVYDVAFTISEDWLADAPGPTVVAD